MKATVKNDRNWIKPPNSMIKKGTKSSPSKISYWIDETGNARLYTKEQLAQCNILMNLNLVLSKAFVLIENIQTVDPDTAVGSLISQGLVQSKISELSPYANFVELIAAIPDITFSEFLGFISQENDPKAYSKLGREKLKEVMENVDPDVRNFFSSDKLEKKGT